ncbi:PREDICTED: uncharacterized protein LOC109580527 [Amphimedon queenslandica]|uniref:Subtilisin n=1 Tax=Amphimedon queenslandica TaxID=400682 RepID=A0AAN0IX66_AMPQE|nr:PREDICTED: uncharacterized protein LOC109580527 [Amphimedon queenslandica]|eukprot:XP_019849359.1 PREDICTED: uncharacterized protein LOC109580527 [Amphimedon queenslandica]
MLVVFSLLVLSTFAVEARRVIRAASGSNTTGNYIIVVTDGVNHSRFMEIVDQVKNETLDSKIYEQVEGPFINIISARITEDAAHRFKGLDDIEFVEEEIYTKASISWAIDRIDQTGPTLDNRYVPEGNGEGVDVYVLDTGILYTHTDFGGRAKYPGFDPDPLWDGKGCGEVSTCCDKGEWFCKDVPKTSSDIELRLCGNEPRENEDTPIEQIELYVQ